jgi:predicted PurR-regulated permease PerM
VLVSIFSVIVMALYLALHPALYREWLIALFPPIHRDLVRDVLGDCADSLRAYIVGLLLTMTFLGTLTAFGLYLLGVPYYVTFGVFTGLATIVPFFGTLLATTLPALFVLTGPDGGTRALWVIGLGILVHLIEGNVVSPYIMSKQVDLPPVLTIVFVLIVGKLLGPLGLLVAVPGLAVIMVVVRRILLSRIYEGQGFRRTTRERPLLLRVPAPEGGVLVPAGLVDVLSMLERRTTAAPV